MKEYMLSSRERRRSGILTRTRLETRIFCPDDIFRLLDEMRLKVECWCFAQPYLKLKCVNTSLVGFCKRSGQRLGINPCSAPQMSH